MRKFELVAENENFVIEFDNENAMYRVSYFEDNHYKDEILFDAVPKTGKWEVVSVNNFYNKKMCKCTACGRYESIPIKVKDLYCANCGTLNIVAEVG